MRHLGWVVAAALLAPRAASACSMCQTAENGEAVAAFVWTTALLSMLPLGMIGGTIYFFYSRACAAWAEDEAIAQRVAATNAAPRIESQPAQPPSGLPSTAL
jgi:hypothetical protein